MKDLIMIFELIDLMNNLYRMILDGIYNYFYLTSHFYYHYYPQCGSFLIQFQLMKDLLMIQLVELIHLMDGLYRMIRYGYFHLTDHFYYNHHLCCSSEFQLMKDLIMIQLVELIHLTDDLYRMIL